MKTIEQIAEEYAIDHRVGIFKPVFIDGFNTAKEHPELLRDLLLKFSEWIHRNKKYYPNHQWPDKWIEELNQTPSH